MMERKYFDCTYGKISYLYRKGDIPIIALHGLGSSSKGFAKMDSYLDIKFSLYFVDLLGHGESEKRLEGYTIDEQTDSIHDFIKNVIKDKPIIMGNSYGGWISVNYVLKYNNAKGLILIDSAGINPPLGDYGENYIEHFINSISKNDFDKIIFKNIIIKNSKTNRLNIDELKNIKIKTIIIWGKYDNIINMEYAKKFHESINNSKLYIVEGGHMPMIDNPEGVSKIINNEF
ncbi:MAG: alpha/beta fold hydrolase [Thermoplasmata archaeon]